MKIKHTVDIKATPARVWEWLGTPEKAMAWQTEVAKTEILHQTPDWIGTTFRETLSEGERATETLGVIVDYRPNELLAMRLNGQYNSVDIQWRLEPIEAGARLTVNANVRFKGFLWVTSILFRSMFRGKLTEQLRQETAKLKELCEQPG